MKIIFSFFLVFFRAIHHFYVSADASLSVTCWHNALMMIIMNSFKSLPPQCDNRGLLVSEHNTTVKQYYLRRMVEEIQGQKMNLLDLMLCDMVFVNMWAVVRIAVWQCQSDSNRTWHERSCNRAPGLTLKHWMSVQKQPHCLWRTTHKTPWLLISDADGSTEKHIYFLPDDAY